LTRSARNSHSVPAEAHVPASRAAPSGLRKFTMRFGRNLLAQWLRTLGFLRELHRVGADCASCPLKLLACLANLLFGSEGELWVVDIE